MKVAFKFIPTRTALAAAALAMAGVGCGGSGGDDMEAPPDAPSTLVNANDVPVDGLSAGDVAKFFDGDDLFDLPFRPADGLGPLYIRTACGSCHAEGGRGPGLVQKMVVVDADGETPSADQSALPFGHTMRPGLAAGATHAIAAPMATNIRTTIRLGPPVLGRGYMEAVADSEIERVAAEQAQRSDGIHGVVNRVAFTSVPNPDTSYSHYQQGQIVIGRFGLKAKVATLDDFTADAFQGDMGMTTPMRPTELPNPDALADDLRPGVDLDIGHVDRVAFYVRHIAIPRRVGLSDTGAALFAQAKCAACHVPTLHTRADYPIAPLADIDAPVYTDFLVHDMGAALADSLVETDATGRMWKTTPLIGLRFFTTFMHDGRAHDVGEAIRLHDGEARTAVDAFNALSAADQQALIQFVEAL